MAWGTFSVGVNPSSNGGGSGSTDNGGGSTSAPGDNQSGQSVELITMAALGGIGSGNAGELEDYSVEVGQFTNSAAGWCSYKFREPFEDVPCVTLQPENFSGWVEIRNITAEGFQYCLRQPSYTEGTSGTAGSVSTGLYWTARGQSESQRHDQYTLVDGVTLPGQPTLPTAANKTTASRIVIHYIAIEYGGER